MNTTTHNGPREAEAALLSWIEDRRAGTAPFRRLLIVVPSQALRTHVIRTIAQRFGAVIGVDVRSLWGLAATLLARTGQGLPTGGELHGIFARRAVGEQDRLVEALAPFEDGPGLALGSLKDLASAGLDRSNLEGAIGCLKSLSVRPDGARGIALLRAAVATERMMDEHGVGLAADLFRDAGRALDDEGERLLQCDAVALHGFVGATGRGRMLLSRVAEARDVHVFLDVGQGPGVPDFVRSFAERLGSVVEDDGGASAAAGQIQLLRASGTAGEITEVAWRIREAIADGIAPEKIAVVARSLEPYALTLRQIFRELAIPFSGGEAWSGVAPGARPGRALAELVELGPEMGTDHWLDAIGEGPFDERRFDAAARADVRLALRAVGAARVADVAALDTERILGDRDGYPLPVRRGARTRDDGDVVLSSGRIPADVLRWIVDLADRTLSCLRDAPSLGKLEHHLATFASLTDGLLGWKGREESWRHALRRLAETPQADAVALERREFLMLLRPLLSETSSTPLGGRGGGVQVLPLARARSLTFDRVFVIGLNRGNFPAVDKGDTLLSDDARFALRNVLPDLGTSADRLPEERHQFEQLLNCAPVVTLSWQRADDEGREREPSPFIDGLRMARPDLVLETVPALEAARLEPPWAGTAHRPLPHRLALRRAALRRDRSGFLELSSEDRGRDRAVAAVQVLDQVDPDRSTPDGRALWRGPSPWYGFIGPKRGELDPRSRRLYVTTLEGISYCPWRMTLDRVLRLAPVPDPLDALPDIDNLLLGNVVHEALERLVVDAGARAGGTLAEAGGYATTSIPRPPAEEIEIALVGAASRQTFERGIVQRGFSRALAARARPLVETALAMDWGARETVAVVGAELEGYLRLGEDDVYFRADRVDRDEDGELALIDYKTGKSSSTVKSVEKRREKLERLLRSGRGFQAAAYAGADGVGRGAFIYLKEGLGEHERRDVIRDDSEDRPLREAFLDGAMRGLRAWNRGIAFARIEGRDEEANTTCNFCDHEVACIKGDSSHRRRLRELARGEHAPESDLALFAEIWAKGEAGDVS